MRVVGYTRVSTSGQARDGLGLPTQQRLIKEWARAHGHRVTHLYIEEGLSGALPETERPALLDALRAVRAHHAEAVVVTSLDRLARSLTVQEGILAQVWKHGASVFTTTGGEVLRDDPDDPMRTAMRQVAGVFAELDRRTIVKRLRDGRRTKRANGGYVGGPPPFGYRVQDGSLVPDVREQEVLGRIQQMRGLGLGLHTIAASLNDSGVAARSGRWHPTTVARALGRKYGVRPSST